MTDQTADTLGQAWERCEALLPRTGRLHLQRRLEAEEIDNDGEPWIARQGRAPGRYEAWATDSLTKKALGFAYQDTPTAALNALADRLGVTTEATTDVDLLLRALGVTATGNTVVDPASLGFQP